MNHRIVRTFQQICPLRMHRGSNCQPNMDLHILHYNLGYLTWTGIQSMLRRTAPVVHAPSPTEKKVNCEQAFQNHKDSCRDHTAARCITSKFPCSLGTLTGNQGAEMSASRGSRGAQTIRERDSGIVRVPCIRERTVRDAYVRRQRLHQVRRRR